MVSTEIAIVTGASRGIGAGIATSLARSGFDVALWARDIGSTAELASQLAGSYGVRAQAFRCDVTVLDSIEAAHEETVARLGVPSALINNAAISSRHTLEDLTASEWDEVIATNLRAPFLCSQIVGRQMLNAGRGCIINIASISGSMPQPYLGAYSASKAGLLALTQQIAVEWGPRGIRCNAISPGFVPTIATAYAYEDPTTRSAREDLVPVRRLGTPDDIGDSVVFLLSDRATYINGANITVDGGLGLTLIGQFPGRTS